MLPVLKWAGGKRWLLARHANLFPGFTQHYVEPFVGGGAIFFALNPHTATLSDLNADLISTYTAIRDDWRSVWSNLLKHQREHNRSGSYYYSVRASKPRTTATRAARFIYLNRTCFNGLYRVNLKGEFNVPKGTKDTVIFDTDDFEAIASRLASTMLQHGDFEQLIDNCREGSFMFIDPPYTVKHNYNGFLKYNEKIFSWADQERLAQAISRLARRGGKALVTNAAHESVRRLYENIGEAHIINRASVLASEPGRRTEVQEIAVTIGYTAQPKEGHQCKSSATAMDNPS